MRTKLRYTARQRTADRKRTVWSVFDTETWAWPAIIYGHHIAPYYDTETDAQAAADQLNAREQS